MLGTERWSAFQRYRSNLLHEQTAPAGNGRGFLIWIQPCIRLPWFLISAMRAIGTIDFAVAVDVV
jgi:hypothetical protein